MRHLLPILLAAAILCPSISEAASSRSSHASGGARWALFGGKHFKKAKKEKKQKKSKHSSKGSKRQPRAKSSR